MRVSGLLLCGLSYAAILRPLAMHIHPQSAGSLAYALAALGFMAASSGSAMLMLGHNLFDEIEVSSRWRGRADLVFTDGARITKTMIAEPAMLVVGRDVDGSWTVRESAGRLMRRFASAQAAERFACRAGWRFRNLDRDLGRQCAPSAGPAYAWLTAGIDPRLCAWIR